MLIKTNLSQICICQYFVFVNSIQKYLQGQFYQVPTLTSLSSWKTTPPHCFLMRLFFFSVVCLAIEIMFVTWFYSNRQEKSRWREGQNITYIQDTGNCVVWCSTGVWPITLQFCFRSKFPFFVLGTVLAEDLLIQMENNNSNAITDERKYFQ